MTEEHPKHHEVSVDADTGEVGRWIAEDEYQSMVQKMEKLENDLKRTDASWEYIEGERARLQDENRVLRKDANDFFYWAEQIASHTFNTTVAYGGEDGEAYKELYPLLREYWDTMYDQRRELGEWEAPAPTQEQIDIIHDHYVAVNLDGLLDYIIEHDISFEVLHDLAHQIEKYFKTYYPYIHLLRDPECGDTQLWVDIVTELHPKEARLLVARIDEWWRENVHRGQRLKFEYDLGYGVPQEFRVKKEREQIKEWVENEVEHGGEEGDIITEVSP